MKTKTTPTKLYTVCINCGKVAAEILHDLKVKRLGQVIKTIKTGFSCHSCGETWIAPDDFDQP